MTLQDLENEVNVTKFCEDISNISAYVATLNDLHDLQKKVKVTQLELDLRLAMVLLCAKFGECTLKTSSDIEQEPSSYAAILNDLCDLENEVMVMRFAPGLHLALVPLCTKSSETSSNISSDIHQKPF